MSEVLALLQTDVVASTELSVRLGDAAMSALWEAHDRIARDLLRDWHGREIDKSDGFLLLFAAAPDAVGYALAYHRALATLALPLKARAGLHVGPLVIRENEAADVTRGAKPLEVDGVAKPTTARIMSLALGGQTLLSAQARAALGTTPVRVQTHGHWRLKGLEEPIELFEAGDAEAPFAPPPDTDKAWRAVRRNELWLPLREVRHSLPAERDAFIGRREALHELARRFETGARLVSLLGTGGTGKTRLAQRFGWTWLGDFPGGVWFCDLSQASTLDGIAHAVAQGLDVSLGSTDPVVQLGNAIAGRDACLVILDNFEQVARHAEATVGRWLDRAMDARFIVTTREVLGIVGEEAMALAPLPADEGAALFMRRAAAAVREFDPNAEDLAAIAPLVNLLDGLPLAIELAAARVRVVPPRMLLPRMGERFKLLASSGGRRDRQATLRATFDWSWELLSPQEKAALAQLSVFEGGFTLESAEAVIDLSAFEAAQWVTDMVQALVEKSLVRRVSDHRFDLLRSVQEYAAEQARFDQPVWSEGPAGVASAQERHWRHFARLDEAGVVADGCVELDNLVVCCKRAASHGDTASAIAALECAWAALKRIGPFGAAVDLANMVQELPSLSVWDRATVGWVEGSALYMLGRDVEAGVSLERGIESARIAGHARAEARLLSALGELRSTAGQFTEARALLDASFALASALGDLPNQCRALNSLGALCADQSLVGDARSLYLAALELARTLNDKRWQGGLLGNLGSLHHGAGLLDEAEPYYRDALALALEAHDGRWEGNTRCNLGLLLHERGDSALAHHEFDRALQIARQSGHVRLECTVLCNRGIVAEALGDRGAAASFHEQALVTALRLGDKHAEAQIRIYLGTLHARGGRLAEANACLGIASQLLAGTSNKIAIGLLYCSLAETAHLAGSEADARSLLELAELAAQAISAGPQSELARRIGKLNQSIVESRRQSSELVRSDEETSLRD